MKYTKAQIDQWLSEWEGSGLSGSKYCQGKRFSKNALYYWDKKRKDKSKTEEVTNKFVPLQILSPPDPIAMSIHYPNGVRIDITSGISISQIKELAGC